ncbi:hypothetical protein [Streptomyces sp. HNM0574]|uniref:hypothetical protein n=1 Tax=Streptomyces sp. HNM0574 TaxID=2714954 RepID=UPI00146F0BB4|nr:hypothetical protein [Streptomyces sp. HNM0574]NLU70990.1 hypothetical protein [Streptomyces sp. HNM0574]
MSIGGDGFGERERTGEDGPAYGHGSGRLTTRTHLPEGEGGGRPPAKPARSLVTVVGVVVLLIAAIAFANQSGDSTEKAGEEPGKNAEQARPTAPTGEKPVDNPGGGIPSGFPHTRQGAESAAANYAVALVSSDIIKPGTRDGVVEQVFTASEQTEMKAKLDKAYAPSFLKKLGLDENGTAKKGTYISRTAPVGTKVLDYGKRTAELEVWCTGVFGTAGEGSTNPVASDWFTMRLNLQWSDGDWKVQGFSQKDGPAPVEGDNRASSADDMAAAVEEYGGFTYAR